MKGFVFFSLLSLTISGNAAVVANNGWISVDSAIINADGSINKTLIGSPNKSLVDSSNVNLDKRAGTEVITCYNKGTAIDRAPATSVIDDWCNNHAIGQSVKNGQTIVARYNYGTFTVLVSGQAINNCGGFIVDGNCNRLLRLPVDGCNTDGENGKQGGYETDLCGQWRIDPGVPGNDF